MPPLPSPSLSPSLLARAGALASRAPGIVRAISGRRPTLLSLTAGVAAISAVANAVAATTPATEQPATRLGTSIQQSVRERDQALAQQKRVLELREQAARATEARLKADFEARQAEATPAGSPAGSGGKAAAADEPYEELARIYQTMKPAKAAVIFERLDLDVQTEIAKRMRERSTALIVSNMKPDAAVQLSMALAGRAGGKARPAVETR